MASSYLLFGFWSLAVSTLSYLLWESVRYGRRLLRQPRLRPLTVPDENALHPLLEKKASIIATANVRAGIEKRRLVDGQEKWVLCAGLRNFREPWARDFGFASFGLLELGEETTVRDCLEVFLSHQRPSGQFPVKMHSTNIVERYLHSLLGREQPITAPLRPKYITAHNTISLDGNALLVIALLNYVKQAGDDAFALTHWGALKRAVAWLEEHAGAEDGLLHQAPFADWADSIARQGRVLYANVLYWKALTDLAAVAPRYGSPEDTRRFNATVQQVQQAINNHFWRQDLGYFVTNERFDNLSSCGNLLAVVWGLATPAQAHSILDAMQRFKMADPVPTQTVHRAYPRRFIALENRLAGIPHYHTSAAWLWLGAWHVVAAARLGRLAEAEALLYRIAQVIVREGAVHEVYAPDGHYLSTFWYTSEAPLTWSAGMVVYAYHVYLRRQQEAGEEGIRNTLET